MAVPGEGPLTPSHWQGSSFSAYREDVQVDFQGRMYRGRLVTESGASPRPLVMVIHNFQGVKLFDEQQAEYIARLGYVGLAIDTYGDAVPREKRPWPKKEEDIPAYMHMVFCEHIKTQHDAPRTRQLLQAWIDAGLAHFAVASSHLPVMIGYSYGGGCCLEAIRGGLKVAGVQAIFLVPGSPEYLYNPVFTPEFLKENGLVELVAELKPKYKPPVNNYNKTAVVLIETGLNDVCVPLSMLTDAMKEFNDAGVDMVVSSYTDTPHGFGLPPNTGPLACGLKERADRRSTEHLLKLCREAWPGVAQKYVEQNAAGTHIMPPLEPVKRGGDSQDKELEG